KERMRARVIFADNETAVEDVQLALGFHGVAVDRIFDLLGSVGKEMAEAAAEEGCAAHLPEQPRQGLGPRGTCGRQEFAELLRKVEQDRARFENAHRLRTTAVEQRRDLRVGVDIDEAAAELIAVPNADGPSVIFGAAVALRQQLLEQDRDLLAIRSRERIELKGMLAHRQ